MTIHVPDYTAIKSKQNAAWSAGNYAKVGVTLQLSGEELAEALDMKPDTKVLDVAAGNGNATLAFARRFCDVTSTDYVPALLDNSRARADAEGLDVRYQTADAEDLPFDASSFDAVISTFGVMFTPDQQKSASEMARVVKSGGKIGLANWTPNSFIDQVFKTIGKHVAPPPGVNSPAAWGDQDWIETTFAGQATISAFAKKNFVFRYRSAEHFMDYFRTYYGPMQKAFLALDEAGQDALYEDMISLIDKFNTANDGTARILSEYAEIVLVKN